MTELSRWVVIDDNDSRIRYSGSWSPASGNTNRYNNQGNFGAVYLNTLHTTTSSSSVSFTFTGSAATIYGTNDMAWNDSNTPVNDPDWECVVDGRVSSSAKANPFRYTENNWVFCNFRDLSAGEHTIQLNVRTKGRAFWLDRILYRPTGIVEGETILATRDDADLEYTGRWGPLAQVAYFTSRTGDSVSFRFTGTGLSLWAMVPTELPHGASDATYSIDGGDDISFVIPALDSTISHYNRRIFETPRLNNGPHTITITYRSGGSTTPLVLDNLLISSGTNRRTVIGSTLDSSPNTDGSNGSSGGGSEGGNSGGSGGNSNSGNGNENASNGNGNGGSSQNATNSDSGTGEGGITSRLVYIRPSDTGTAAGSDGTSVAGSSNGSNSLNGASDNGTSSSTSKPPIGAIIGGVLGGLAIILIAMGILLYLRRTRERKAAAAFEPANLTAAPLNTHRPGGAPQMSYSSTAYTFPSRNESQNLGSSNYSNSQGHVRAFSNPDSEGASVGASDHQNAYGGMSSNPFDNPPPLYHR